MTRNRYLKLCMIILSLLLIAACKTTAQKNSVHAEEISTLNDDEIFIVGKIEIVPKIRKEEQKLQTGGSGRLANKVHVFFSDKFVDIFEESFSILSSISEVPLEEDFVVEVKKSGALYYSGGNVWLESSASHSGYMNNTTSIRTGKLRLPGDMVYKLQPGDKAVYVGTIRYSRDANNAITKVTYINEYAKANAKFHAVVKNPALKLRMVSPQKQKGVW